ncbi:CvpA family protein [Pontiella agarivorans]|uniref:CvpA family protein n=1 Tax=Pontiella agarivorans TaxID=3038953 RepID=A0ABU5MV58_9BACT|nr:CvpA family protein [Pontiella agarivorans]MDZ8118100.1 CvpA family protein [Pontiella agarivorans]
MLPNWLSFVDAAYVLIVCLFAWGGLQKGFAAQVAHVITFVAVGALLYFAYPFCFVYFGRIFRNLEETYLMWILLCLLLLAGAGIFVLFSKILAAVLKSNVSDAADAGWGTVLGLIHGALFGLIALIILVMVDRTGGSYDKLRMKSYVGKTVCHKIVPRIQPRLTTLYENKIRDWKAELLRREEAASEVDM